jgi:hypothetical protein
MPKALEDYGSPAACGDPEKAMRAIAEKLGAREFGVRSPEWEERGRLTVSAVPCVRLHAPTAGGKSWRD